MERWNNECLQLGGGATFLPAVLRILYELIGITNAETYRQVLIQYAIPSGNLLIGNGLEVFQNYIPSTLLMPVKSYLERKTADKTLTVMDWSPDLNIIEAVWDHLDRNK